mgnify:CR=1 FL=1
MNSDVTNRGTQTKSGAASGKDEAVKCMSCGADSKTRPLLSCMYKGETKWVCVRCLPMLIHGTE